MTYSSDDTDGAIVTNLTSAKTHLGVKGNTVTVTYYVNDAAGNHVIQKTAKFTEVN